MNNNNIKMQYLKKINNDIIIYKFENDLDSI